MAQTRLSRAAELTWCTACQSWAGVTRTPFNRYPREQNAPKITGHKRADGSPCVNGRASLTSTAEILPRAEVLARLAG